VADLSLRLNAPSLALLFQVGVPLSRQHRQPDPSLFLFLSLDLYGQLQPFLSLFLELLELKSNLRIKGALHSNSTPSTTPQ
jgi:hypothetical protein